MKKTSMILRAMLFSVALYSLSACSGFNPLSFFGNNDDTVDYLPVQTTDGGSWHFINAKGERIGSQEWEFEPTMTVGGIFTAQTDSGLTVYQWDGDVAQPIEGLVNLAAVGEYREGLMPVVHRLGRIEVVDNDGDVKFALDPIDGKEISVCHSRIADGMLIVTNEDGKDGVVDKKGNVVVKPAYEYISNFNDGVALAVNTRFDSIPTADYFIIDKEGKVTEVAKRQLWAGEEAMCGLPGFNHGVVYIWCDNDTADNKQNYIRITADGQIKKTDKQIIDFLPDGAIIEMVSKPDYNNLYILKNKEGKELVNAGDNMLSACGRFVIENKYNTATQANDYTFYDQTGAKISTMTSENWVQFIEPGGEFPLLVNDSSYGKAGNAKFVDDKFQPLPGMTYVGVGTKRMIELFSEVEGECDASFVGSAYIDLTAAASKMASLLSSGSISGKESYYLGQPFSELLKDYSASHLSSETRTYAIPTDTTGSLARGAGFYVYGEAESTDKVISPTYSKYFDVAYYDYYGTAWGYWKNRQSGVKFNPSAKVKSFDLRLHTNYPTGKELRQAIARHLKKGGYTQTASTPNYDEYNNGYNSLLVYGSDNSKGVGGLIMTSKDFDRLSDSKKSSYAAAL